MSSLRRLTALGPVAAVVFVVVATIGVLTRPGFDLAVHAISMLSLGEDGWLMTANFLLTGVFTVLAAVGLRALPADQRGGAAGPVLLGVFGAGLVLAGIFPAPAGLGFPDGVPADQQPVMTPTAIGHSIAFNLAFTALIVATFVVGVRDLRAGRRARGTVSVVIGVLLPVLIATGMASVIPTGVAFYLAAVLAWVWVAIACIRPQREAVASAG